MNCLRVCTWFTVVPGWVFLFPFFAGQVQAEELRPYSPPIQQQAPRMEKRQPSFQKALPAPKPVEPADPLEAYYLQFERKAATLTPEQRAQLIDAFSDQLDTARESKQWEQVAHYARLIEILGRRR